MISTIEFMEYVERGEVPPFPPHTERIWDPETPDRNDFTERGMWAIVDKQWTKRLADQIGDRRCLEIMAGAGWLAKALAEHGIDIIATDSGAWDKRHSKIHFVHDIERIDAVAAVEKYADRDVLIVSWPPYTDTAVIAACSKWGGDIVYIGELEGGCNAPEEFFHSLDVTKRMSIPQWDGIHDVLLIGRWATSKGVNHELTNRNN